MPITTIQLVLRDEHHFLSHSAALFFRFKLKQYATEEVKRNKKSFPRKPESGISQARAKLLLRPENSRAGKDAILRVSGVVEHG